MALFRELDAASQSRIEAELIRRESTVREITLQLAGRSNIMLFVGLIIGAIAALGLVTTRHPAPTTALVSAVCFLGGLLMQGITFCLASAALWKITFQFGGYKAAVLASQTDTAGLNIAATPRRFDKMMLWFGFVPFVLWIAGCSFGVSALVFDPPRQFATYYQAPLYAPSVVASTPSVASTSVVEPASLPKVGTPKTGIFANWSLSDKIAFWAVLAAIVQAIALLMTFRLTGLATRRELRAYVFPETFDLYDGTTVVPSQPAYAGEPSAVLILKNSGRTPAYKVVSLAQFAVIEPIHEQQLVVAPLVDKYSANLGPGTSIRNGPRLGRHLTPSEIADINAGAKGLYLYGRIEYRDIFKKKRFTAFRMRYLGQYPPTGPATLNFTEGGNQID